MYRGEETKVTGLTREHLFLFLFPTVDGGQAGRRQAGRRQAVSMPSSPWQFPPFTQL